MNIHLLGIPMDLGQKRRGVDMGPSALRYAGLAEVLARLGHQVTDFGNLIVPNPEEKVAAKGENRIKAVANICQGVFEQGISCIGAGATALFLGGDHSISIGSVKAAASSNPETLGVLWIDAHADYNTPKTSPSGNIHGMPMAVLTGHGAPALLAVGDGLQIPAENIVQIGIRDIDPAEAVRLKESNINLFTMREIDENGIASVARAALSRLGHCDRFHVSLDLDALDPQFAPGVGTPVRGGFSYREAHLLGEILADTGKVKSLDVVEINPILDDQNKTAELAVELTTSLLGKQII
ncbi:MAG: arginase [Chloroflexota bacterium]